MIDALFELFFDGGFAAEFFVQLQVEFDVEGGPFGLYAAVEGVVDDVGGAADGRVLSAIWFAVFMWEGSHWTFHY